MVEPMLNKAIDNKPEKKVISQCLFQYQQQARKENTGNTGNAFGIMDN